MTNLYIAGVKLDKKHDDNDYPYNLPAIQHIAVKDLELTSSVTFFVGENGAGKSTLLEAIAVAWGFNPEGGSRNFNFTTKETHSELHNSIRLIKGVRKSKDGYFLRAESWYNVSTNIDELDQEPGGGAALRNAYGGVSLHKQSHGESFMSLVSNRLSGNGLYVFDEPEAALSPQRQLEILAHIRRLVENGSQLIIATHSPIIMAYPGADILEFTKEGIAKKKYEDTEHFNLYKEFLDNPHGYTRHIIL